METQTAVEQAVSEHFERSLGQAYEKRMNIKSNIPPPVNRDSSGGTSEVDVTQHSQKRLLAADENMVRDDHDREYYTGSQIQPKPQNVGSKVEYLPPAAHSSVVDVKPPQSAYTPAGFINLCKDEPNFNLFGYPAIELPLGFIAHDPNKIQGDVKISQPAQPSSIERNLPNTKIVKNEGKTGVIEDFKVTNLSLSQSFELHGSEAYFVPPTNNLQLKTPLFEYTNALTLPHPQYEAQNLPSTGQVHSIPPVQHHARQFLHPYHRHFPYQPTLTQGQSPHFQHRQSVLPPDLQYALSIASLEYAKISALLSYPYPPSVIPPIPTLHYAPIANRLQKSKVNRPTRATSPQTLVYRKPISGTTTGTQISSLRMNAGPNNSGTLDSSVQCLNLSTATAQPLQMSALTSRKKKQNMPPSRKHKVNHIKKSLKIKKQTIEEPVLSLLSETNPLLTSAAKTVVNTAISEGLNRPKNETAQETPAPPVCHSPINLTKPVSFIESEKSNIHGPPSCPSSYAVYKLRKAWLQRYFSEDGTGDENVVASGSCITLPLTGQRIQ